jgi:arylsulfatase A-like enzyme
MRRRPELQTLCAAACLTLSLVSSGCGFGSPEPRLLILITVDTLRADRLGAGGSTLGLTPHIDALAAESHFFRSAYAPTSFTLPSISSLMTGQYPEELGIASNRSALRSTIPTLASVLHDHGWRTAAVVSNFVLRRNSGLAVGFDHYDDTLPQTEAVRRWPERIASSTTDAAIAALEAWPEDPGAHSFLWVHFQDPHGPYTPPDGYRERFLTIERDAPDGEHELPQKTGRGGRGLLPSYQQIGDARGVAFYRAGYDGEIAYLDEEVGRLLIAIDERGPKQRNVVVFTADHGESLGEQNYWFAHGERLSDPLVRVPLMIRAPGVDPEVRSDIASLVDLYPTLLGLTIGAPSDARGRNLMVPREQRRPSEPYLATLGSGSQKRIGIVEGPNKLVLTRVGSYWKPELYRHPMDGPERRSNRPEIRDRLRAKLDLFRNNLKHREPELRQRLSSDAQQKLRALGYAEDSADDSAKDAEDRSEAE